MRYLDTHQHLIERDDLSYSWTNDIDALSQGNFTAHDYDQLVGDRVAKALFMETGVDDADWQNETRLMARKLKDDPKFAGIIASCRPEDDEGFDTWLEECRALPVVGFRRILHVEPDELSQSERFRRNVRKLGEANFSFDLCFLQRQLPIAYDLARACDNTQLILNHCGVPTIEADAFEDWKSNMARLAELPHLACKLSGISAYGQGQDTGLADYRPWVDAVLELFGSDRIVWGSDWPVVNLGAGLTAWLDASDQILNALSDVEASNIAYKNAERIYGLEC